MKRISLTLVIITVGSLTVVCWPVIAKEESGVKSKGTLTDKRLSPGDLGRILTEHSQWLKSAGKEGQRAALRKPDLSKVHLTGADLREADLTGADLTGADLTGADLTEAHLCGAHLNGAHLRGANLNGAYLTGADLGGTDLRGAHLRGADLSEADLTGTDLTGANLRGADLRGANLSEANLTGANLGGADLSGADLRGANLEKSRAPLAYFFACFFEPMNVSGFVVTGARGLSDIKFLDPTPTVNLRKVTMEFGSRSEVAALTSALRKFQLRKAPIHVKVFEGIILGGRLTDYGAQPWYCVVLLGILIVGFSPIYILVVVFTRGKAGIWISRPIDYLFQHSGKKRPVKVTSKLLSRTHPSRKPGTIIRMIIRGFRLFRFGLYFSLLSAFQIGWRELNVGTWITRIQSREYNLKPRAWLRTVSGVQSLTSVYLLALWVLTYFGRPFE